MLVKVAAGWNQVSISKSLGTMYLMIRLRNWLLTWVGSFIGPRIIIWHHGMKPTLAQNVVSYLTVPLHYLINSSPPGQKWQPFCRRHFQTHFHEWKGFLFWFEFRFKFVPMRPINNIPALVQIMALCQPGDKPLSEPMLTQFTDAYTQLAKKKSN